MSSKTVGNKKQSPTNKRLADSAVRVIETTGSDARRGMCQKAVREAVQQEYGSKYDEYHRGTAHASMLAWKQSEYAHKPSDGSVIGDILYKAGDSTNPAGHCGIRVAGNKVAENATTKIGRVRGAYGYRTLEEFGGYALIVRLPE